MRAGSRTIGESQCRIIAGLADGFSLLEALVAIALISMALLPLMSLQQSDIGLARRTEVVSRRGEVSSSALAFVAGINPDRNPSGAAEIAPYEIYWTSKVIGAARPSAARPFGVGRFMLTLYELDIEVIDTVTAEAWEISVRRIGSTATRPPETGSEVPSQP